MFGGYDANRVQRVTSKLSANRLRSRAPAPRPKTAGQQASGKFAPATGYRPGAGASGIVRNPRDRVIGRELTG